MPRRYKDAGHEHALLQQEILAENLTAWAEDGRGIVHLARLAGSNPTAIRRWLAGVESVSLGQLIRWAYLIGHVVYLTKDTSHALTRQNPNEPHPAPALDDTSGGG